MIIAKFGQTKFILSDIKAAEQLLGILARAQAVSENYLYEERRHILIEDTQTSDASISIVADQKVHTAAEAAVLIADDRKAEREKAQAGEEAVGA